ncbi:unnamed protein product [Trichobilharzia szidati]|nr:unnamed protein product [Trichobilharzia szidati]
MHQITVTPTCGPSSTSSSLPTTLITQTSGSCPTPSQENISTISDDDDGGGGVGGGGGGSSDGELWAPLAVRGYLSKWTNLLHGWQERYFILSDGFLTYYRNAEDLDLGSRGSVRIKNAYVKTHEYDECRFEVRVGDVIWYLRGLSQEERYNWISAIERHRIAESGYGSEKTIHRHSSLLSLNSTHSPSIHSTSSFKRNHGLKEKLAEMETFKEILCKQVDSLQAYFDACSAIVQHHGHENIEKWFIGENHMTTSSSPSSFCSSTSNSKEEIDDYEEEVKLNEKKQSRNKLNKAEKNRSNDERKATNVEGGKSLVECASNVTLTSSSGDNCLADKPAFHSDSKHASDVDCRVLPDKDSIVSSGSSSAAKSGGFFSRFLPFRNFGNTSTAQTVGESENMDDKVESTVASEDNNNKNNDNNNSKEVPQYQPSSRFNDLRRILEQHGAYALDFKGEAHMFKAITAGILTNLSNSVEMMQQHEEHWRKRLEREIEKRRRSEETQKAMGQELLHLRSLIGLNTNHQHQWQNQQHPHHHQHYHLTNNSSHSRFSSYGSIDFQHSSPDVILREHGVKSTTTNVNSTSVTPTVNTTISSSAVVASENVLRLVGPDYEEGINSPIREEEFFDAIDAESDKIEENEVRLAALKSASEAIRWARAMPSNHPLYNELDKIVKMHVKNFATTQIFDYTLNLCSSSSSIHCNGGNSIPSNTVDSKDTANLSVSEQNFNETPENWRLVVQDGDMIIFRRELETDDGVVLDPLQAIDVVHGVTAKEICTYFWDVRYRMDWEFTVDQAPTVLEVCGDDTVVIHQVYKRVWPTTQRDALFWSHICPVNPIHQKAYHRKLNHSSSMSMSHHPSSKNYTDDNDDDDKNENNISHSKVHQRSASMDGGGGGESSIPENSTPNSKINDDKVLDGWMVINMSTDYLSDKIQPSPSPTVRLGLEVVLFCRTELITNNNNDNNNKYNNGSMMPNDIDDLSKLTRDQIQTRLVYMANINPGGWVPAAGLRSLARREYPRFLKRFSAYVKDQTKHKTPLF